MHKRLTYAHKWGGVLYHKTMKNEEKETHKSGQIDEQKKSECDHESTKAVYGFHDSIQWRKMF